jgi:hypothetical protein
MNVGTPNQRGPSRRRRGALVLSVVAGLLACGCPRGSPVPPAAPPEPAGDITEQVHTFCGACHAYPPADSFPRSAWQKEVERGYSFFERSGLALAVPPVQQVIQYYQERAPRELPPARITYASTPLGVQFERTGYPGPGPAGRPHSSNVLITPFSDPRRPDILTCDMATGLVMALRPYDPAPTWRVLGKVKNPAHIEVVDLDGDGIKDVLVADLGNFPPTDLLCGRVVWLRGRPDGSFTPITLLEGVGRVADVQAADFRGTGKKDLVVAAFGWQSTGEILFLENQTTDWSRPRFVPHVLDERHGAIHVPVADLNGDGRPDFVALIAQEHEVVVAFLNEGNGKFRKKTLYAAPHPAWGSSGIQLVDLNGDGKLDVLYTNGDTLDEPYLFKPYHGIQWLENKGNLRFEHHHLAPMYGVHRAVAGKITGSDRLDILAVSFLPSSAFPGRKQRGADAIILLEQTAPGKFVRHALRKVQADHVSCAVGDLYGTGRSDLVIGNYGSQDTDQPVQIWKNLGRKDEGRRRKEE